MHKILKLGQESALANVNPLTMWCRFIRLHYTPPLPTDESAEVEADMAKMMFLIVKRQWQQHQQQLTALFAVCGHKQNYLNDQVSLN